MAEANHRGARRVPPTGPGHPPAGLNPEGEDFSSCAQDFPWAQTKVAPEGALAGLHAQATCVAPGG